MRRGTIGLTALLVTLLGSSQAVASERPNQQADLAVTASRAVSGVRTVDVDLEQARAASFSNTPFLIGSGSSTAMIGSLPLTAGVDVGVGFFSVVGATERELVRRRTDPSREVRSRDSRVAAVGMSLRF
jgi:hypothetical protein